MQTSIGRRSRGGIGAVFPSAKKPALSDGRLKNLPPHFGRNLDVRSAIRELRTPSQASTTQQRVASS
jgi:hypothetical protein